MKENGSGASIVLESIMDLLLFAVPYLPRLGSWRGALAEQERCSSVPLTHLHLEPSYQSSPLLQHVAPMV